MKVSIITATFNSEKTLQNSIDSVKNQNYGNIEHIIIDGGSTDGTLDIIKKNAEHIANYVSEKDTGIYNAINKGITLATGDVIGILNSDDVYASEQIITKIVECFNAKNSDVVYGNLIYVSNEESGGTTIRYWKSNVFQPGCLKYGWMPPHPTLYCRKDVYDSYGLYNESLKIASDYDFILRIFKQFELKKNYLPIVMVKMTLGGMSNASFKNILMKSKEDLRVIKANHTGNFTTLIFKNIRKVKQLISARI